MEDNQPKGIGFFNIKSGETHYARLEAQIQAYINSSDMGINASRDQDFGWRLEPSWVKAVKAYRRDENKMSALVARNGGQKPTTVQVLYAIYGEQLRVAQERAEEEESPFEEEYLQNIASPKGEPVVAPAVPNVPEDEGADDVNTSVPTNSADSVTSPSETESTPVDGDKPADTTQKSKSQQRREDALKQK